MPELLTKSAPYVLDEQVGFLLRRAWQRHVAIFTEEMGEDLTPMQFSVLVRLAELGSCSQNRLGRLVATDAATIKGVVDRLAGRGLVETAFDPSDRRRLMISITDQGGEVVGRAIEDARAITRTTLEPLGGEERETLLRLLAKLT